MRAALCDSCFLAKELMRPASNIFYICYLFVQYTDTDTGSEKRGVGGTTSFWVQSVY